MAESEMVKVRFQLPSGYETETVWADRVSPDQFRIENSPFFMNGVSFQDIVRAKEADGFFEFEEVVTRGGHSTYRIFMQGARTLQDDEFRHYWGPISALGATYENGNGRYITVDIPPGKNVAAIYKLLEAGEEVGVWAFDEGHFEPEADSARKSESWGTRLDW